MGSWMEKFERKEDEQRERKLNEKLENAIEEYNNYNMVKEINKIKLVKKLEAVVEAYKRLIIEACEFDQKDFEEKQKELSTLKYELMQERNNGEKDLGSWDEYKNEEIENERE